MSQSSDAKCNDRDFNLSFDAFPTTSSQRFRDTTRTLLYPSLLSSSPSSPFLASFLTPFFTSLRNPLPTLSLPCSLLSFFTPFLPHRLSHTFTFLFMPFLPHSLPPSLPFPTPSLPCSLLSFLTPFLTSSLALFSHNLASLFTSYLPHFLPHRLFPQSHFLVHSFPSDFNSSPVVE